MEDFFKQFNQYLYWYEVMKSDIYWKDARFKKLNVVYPRFVLHPHLFSEVDLVEFLKIEQNRLPLFIGSQFGISPRLEKVYSVDTENRFIAILCKSFLSGAVAGLKIYLLKRNYELEDVIYFKNDKQ